MKINKNWLIIINKILLVFLTFSVHGQEPALQWQNTIGGNKTDNLAAGMQTTDGGFIIGGYSYTGINGDKTEANMYGPGTTSDYWVIKTNSLGVITWQNTIGGTNNDALTCLDETTDGGYILGGYSYSNVTGDKNEANIGNSDYWIVKLNSLGTIVWQNTIGSTGADFLRSIKQTSDGGFILGGYSYLGGLGDKTDPGVGAYDYWVLKLNSIGEIIWQNSIGGAADDILTTMSETTDGGFIISGFSESGISGDKTEINVGDNDYWIVKLNNLGSIEWENTIGGLANDYLYQITQTTDNGYILSGNSNSPISGDKNEKCLDDQAYDDGDIWIIKLFPDGEIEWQNTIGGNLQDDLNAAIQTPDGGYFLAGFSDSELTSDLTDYIFDITEETDGIDYWVMKLDPEGNILWQNIIGGSSDDFLVGANYCADGGYFIYGNSFSPISDDKTEGNKGGSDYWIIKLAPDLCSPSPYYSDMDNDEHGVPGILGYVCELPSGGDFSFENDDCNDLYSSIYPDALEICDGFDNNCDGDIDEFLISCNPGPTIQFQNTIGGNHIESADCIIPTDDNGFIICGSSGSNISCDKTENSVGDTSQYVSDAWIIKLDSALNIIWQNTIGGSAYESFHSVIQTIDGGFIAVGGSISGISGDKTEAVLGGYDIWVVKMDAIGNIVWQNTIGGNSDDGGPKIIQTIDGGYLIGAYSKSGISGDKSEALIGATDIWIIKIDNLGNIIWQNTIGGSSSDTFNSFAQTSDGGFIVGAYSSSNISGDKTENNLGFGDLWIIKLDDTGNIVWEQTIGGSGSESNCLIQQTADLGFLIGSSSSSGVSFDKSEPAVGVNDYWFIKLDIAGNIIWQKTIGGNDYDNIQDISLTEDFGFVAIGMSFSTNSGNKVEPLNGISDIWVLKFDEIGNIEWQNTIGGNQGEETVSICQSSDGSYCILSSTNSGISGDKTENNCTSYYRDFWVIKLAPDCTPTPELCNSLDDNCNGLIDDGITETISISAGGPITFCQGGNVLLTATYSGATVQWKKNGTNIPGAISPTYLVTTKGTYTCETTSACDTELSTGIFVNVQKNPPANITAGDTTTFCAGGSVILTANAGGGLSYQWYKGASLIAGATSINYTATIAGNYKCRVAKTATGCFKNSNVINVSVPCKEGVVSANNPITNNQIIIFPNPATDVISITINSLITDNSLFIITDITGKTISTFPITSSTMEINISNYAPGMYSINVNVDGNEFINKFIKQ